MLFYHLSYFITINVILSSSPFSPSLRIISDTVDICNTDCVT